jgi:hypothetical protein
MGRVDRAETHGGAGRDLGLEVERQNEAEADHQAAAEGLNGGSWNASKFQVGV